ncbi:hypothetical protein AOLI_G00329600 [Acnodon oligacanthus]
MRRHYRPSSGSDRRTNPGAWGAAPPSAELSARCREVTEQPVRMLSAASSLTRNQKCSSANLTTPSELRPGRAVAGVQGARERAERTAPRSSGALRVGEEGATSLGRSGSPAARRTVRSPIPKGPSAIVGVTSTTDRSANEGLTDQPVLIVKRQRCRSSLRPGALSAPSERPQRLSPQLSHSLRLSGRERDREIPTLHFAQDDKTEKSRDRLPICSGNVRVSYARLSLGSLVHHRYLLSVAWFSCRSSREGGD